MNENRLNIEIEKSPLGDVSILVVRLQGELLYGQQHDLRESVLKEIDETTRGAVIEMSDVGMIDSAGLGTLAALTSRLAAKGGSLVLAGLDAKLENVIRLSGMGDMFLIVEGEEDAMRFFSSRLNI
jgi:anti-anti-sigma factor